MNENTNAKKRGLWLRAATVAVALAAVATLCVLASCSPGETTSDSGSEATSTSSDLVLTVSTPLTAVAEETPTTDKHAEFGVSCASCHGEDDPTSAPLSDEACLSCHDYDALVESTADYEDVENRSVNPHDNHMHGTSCFSCHSNHGESSLACNDCHTNEYDWIVP